MSDTVLIVDDDEAVQTMLYKVIRSNGLQAQTASSGEQALKLLAVREYDLILLDVNMHGIDGFEVVQRLRRRVYAHPSSSSPAVRRIMTPSTVWTSARMTM